MKSLILLMGLLLGLNAMAGVLSSSSAKSEGITTTNGRFIEILDSDIQLIGHAGGVTEWEPLFESDDSATAYQVPTGKTLDILYMEVICGLTTTGSLIAQLGYGDTAAGSSTSPPTTPIYYGGNTGGVANNFFPINFDIANLIAVAGWNGASVSIAKFPVPASKYPFVNIPSGAGCNANNTINVVGRLR